MADEPRNIDIDLNGWDTAFVISLAKANESIVKNKVTPPQIDYKIATQDDTVIQGTWGDWQFTADGGGQLIDFCCPLLKGTFNYDAIGVKGLNLDNITFNVQFRLASLHNAELAAARGVNAPDIAVAGDVLKTPGAQQNFVTNLEGTSETPAAAVIGSSLSIPQSGPNAGKLVNNGVVIPTPPGMEIICKTMIENFVKQWFCDDGLKAFTHIFAMFLVNSTADHDEFQWLMPTDLSYAVAMSHDNSLEKSALGVMCMTENRSAHNASPQVDGRLLQACPNSDSVFAINGLRFVDKWLMPGATSALAGTSAKDFAYSEDGLTIYNRKDAIWGQFEAEGGSHTTAHVPNGNFSIGLQNDAFVVSFTDINWLWDTTWGNTVHANFQERYQLSLKSGTGYKNTLVAHPYQVLDENGNYADAPPLMTYTVQETDAAKWEKIAIDIGISIAGSILGGAIAGKLAGGAVRAVAAGGEAGADAVVNLGEALAKTALTAAEETTIQATSEAGALSASETVTEVTTNGLARAGSWLASKATSFGRFIYRIRWTMLGSVIGGGVGAGIGDIPKIIEAANYDNLSDIGSFDSFASNCVGTIHWPGHCGFELTEAKLAGALLLGGTLKSE